MRIKAGKYYICKSTHTRLAFNNGLPKSGTFYEGKIYYSEADNKITDNKGICWNQITSGYCEYFEECKNYYINSKEIRKLCNS